MKQSNIEKQDEFQEESVIAYRQLELPTSNIAIKKPNST